MKSPDAGMTVNERLVVSGLMDSYEKSMKRKDFVKAAEILGKVEIGEENIRAILDNAAKKGTVVVTQITNKHRAGVRLE